MSNAPHLLKNHRKGSKMGDSTLIDSMIHDGLWDGYNDVHMGTTGETIAEDSTGDRSFEDGRVAFYMRSRLNDRWAVTATADTGEAALDDLFDGLGISLN